MLHVFLEVLPDTSGSHKRRHLLDLESGPVREAEGPKSTVSILLCEGHLSVNTDPSCSARTRERQRWGVMNGKTKIRGLAFTDNGRSSRLQGPPSFKE